MKLLRRARRLAPMVCLFFGAAIFIPRISVAQTIRVNIDPEQTQIRFTLGATLHTVHGTFKLKRGEITFDKTSGRASGAIIIDAASGDSGNAGRDRKMHKTVLESAKYPEVVLVTRQVQGHIALDGSAQVQIQGLIRLHGSEHAIVVPVETQISNGRMKATLHFAIPYVQWGLKDPSTFLLRVEKIVNIEVEAEGQVAAAP